MCFCLFCEKRKTNMFNVRSTDRRCKLDRLFIKIIFEIFSSLQSFTSFRQRKKLGVSSNCNMAFCYSKTYFSCLITLILSQYSLKVEHFQRKSQILNASSCFLSYKHILFQQSTESCTFPQLTLCSQHQIKEVEHTDLFFFSI